MYISYIPCEEEIVILHIGVPSHTTPDTDVFNDDSSGRGETITYIYIRQFSVVSIHQQHMRHRPTYIRVYIKPATSSSSVRLLTIV